MEEKITLGISISGEAAGEQYSIDLQANKCADKEFLFVLGLCGCIKIIIVYDIVRSPYSSLNIIMQCTHYLSASSLPFGRRGFRCAQRFSFS